MKNKNVVLGMVLCMFMAFGCNKDKDVKSATGDDASKLQTVELSTSGLELEKIDINNDGKVDQQVYSKDGKPKYIIRDFNFDGLTDMIEFYDDNGKHTRDEIDLDYDGNCDLIVTYENEVVKKKEFSIDFESNRHGIQMFDAQGNRTEIRRDTDHDGVIDTIEYYNAGEDEPYKVDKK